MESDSGPRRKGAGTLLFRGLLGVLFAVMAVELVVSVRQNKSLKETVSELRREVLAAQEQTLPALEEGQVVPPLMLTSLEGEAVVVDYEDPVRDTFLLIFSPGCPTCIENMGNWKELESKHGSGDKLLYYVSAGAEEDTRTLAQEHQLPGVLLADPEDLSPYRVSSIPTTILVGPGGKVKRAWVGMLPDGAGSE